MAAQESRELLDYFERRRDELIEELASWVRFDTPTGHAERIAAFAGHYASGLEAAGLTCERIDDRKGPHLLAERAGVDPPIVLVGHTDTVWPDGEATRRPPEVRDGRLWGPGVYDMKAGLGLILWSLRHLSETRPDYRRRILVFISADEEHASETARPWMDARLPTEGVALVPEPPCPDGSLKISRKGVGLFDLEVIGREVHAGVEPEKGISAISEAARFAIEIETWRNAARGQQTNVGTFEGGTATNVVAGRATLGIDFRYESMADGRELEAKLRALRPRHPEAKVNVTGSLAFPPMIPNAQSRELSERLGAIAHDEFGETGGA
ncbi:MAG: M20/M25/M40 family metallo-hydrolase, partial [Planctomycetota bacterium]